MCISKKNPRRLWYGFFDKITRQNKKKMVNKSDSNKEF